MTRQSQTPIYRKTHRVTSFEFLYYSQNVSEVVRSKAGCEASYWIHAGSMYCNLGVPQLACLLSRTWPTLHNLNLIFTLLLRALLNAHLTDVHSIGLQLTLLIKQLIRCLNPSRLILLYSIFSHLISSQLLIPPGKSQTVSFCALQSQ